MSLFPSRRDAASLSAGWRRSLWRCLTDAVEKPPQDLVSWDEPTLRAWADDVFPDESLFVLARRAPAACDKAGTHLMVRAVRRAGSSLLSNH